MKGYWIYGYECMGNYLSEILSARNPLNIAKEAFFTDFNLYYSVMRYIHYRL